MARYVFLAIFTVLFTFGAMALITNDIEAASLETVVSTRFDAETIVKGFTLESDDKIMRLGIRPNTLNVSTRVDIKTLEPELMEGTYPEGKKLLGNVYLFDILNKESYDGSDFFFLEIKYPEDDAGRIACNQRKIYFYNAVAEAWQVLPSEDSPETGSVRALIHLPYARLAIFENDFPETGLASWYSYQNCDCAASPDYAKGSYLVVSLADEPEKSVTVLVNDFGPDREIHPERIIDLDKVAYQKLAPLGSGIINVTVKLLQ